ncbi:MAG: hypothetical protein HY313_11040 [Acidobacteria bacterium]|nr:hypothetical protein [Acidobacteriota bacterium]
MNIVRTADWSAFHTRFVEALHVIGTVGNDENFDELLDIAQRNFIDTSDLELTAADLAVRIWLEVPQTLERLERSNSLQRRRKFESLRARRPEDGLPTEGIPRDFLDLEQALDDWFGSRKRGVGCKIIRKDGPGEVRFLVQHGQLCRREPSRKGVESTCTFFRPEKTDVVIYDPSRNELRINTSTLGELLAYRQLFGLHLFGDSDKFTYTQKYTLDPLKELGSAALRCRDLAGIEWIRLREVEYSVPGRSLLIERLKGDDVFIALADRERRIPPEVEIKSAVFRVKLESVKSARSVSIRPPNIAGYGRGDEAVIIEQWLQVRGFIVTRPTVEYEETEQLVPRA